MQKDDRMHKSYRLEKFASGMHYILLDATTVKKFTRDGNKRVICQLTNGISFHCAIMPKKEGGHFVNIGAAICRKLGIKEGSVIQASFSADTSTYQFDMPEEFAEVLHTDPEARQRFHALTVGNQRGLIYLVSQVKTTDKRIERSLRIAEKLKNGISAPRLMLR